MSKAKKCDRCGIFYEQLQSQAEAIEMHVPYELYENSGRQIDLCTSCTNALQEFVEAGKVEKPKTYAEHFLSKFPNAEIADDGFPSACAKRLYKEICCKGRCSRNCVKCWSQPLPPTPEAKEPNQ